MYKRQILDFLEDHPDALHRSCGAGHLTGSALVADPYGEQVVVLHHRKLDRWLQPGGHCDGDANLAAVALREATEETGRDDLRVHPVAVDTDVHRVAPPGEEPHLHLDVRFLVVATAGIGPLPGNHESHAVRWARPDELPSLGADESLLRLTSQALRVLRRED